MMVNQRGRVKGTSSKDRLRSPWSTEGKLRQVLHNWYHKLHVTANMNEMDQSVVMAAKCFFFFVGLRTVLAEGVDFFLHENNVFHEVLVREPWNRILNIGQGANLCRLSVTKNKTYWNFNLIPNQQGTIVNIWGYHESTSIQKYKNAEGAVVSWKNCPILKDFKQRKYELQMILEHSSDKYGKDWWDSHGTVATTSSWSLTSQEERVRLMIKLHIYILVHLVRW
jgi:hypothetical protein